MAKLTTKQRNALPASAFALPAKRAYPDFDFEHAVNAKARASQAHAKGLMSAAQEAGIVADANKVIKRRKRK